MQVIGKNDMYGATLSHALFSGINFLSDSILEHMVNEIYYSLCSVGHSICHWLIYHFIRRKERVICNNKRAIIAAVINYPCVTPQNRIFMDISLSLRNVYLFKPRSRGSDDDVSVEQSNK